MSEGLRFECQPGCTACCEREGHVYLTEQDLPRAADFLGISVAIFEQRYVYRTSRQLRLRMPRNARCYFLQEGGCSIHAAKPAQCRVFPFWPELVDSRREWRMAAKYCPGIGKGALIQIETARALGKEMRDG